MPKRKKSNKLYAILAMPLSIKRDRQLSGILDSDYIDNYPNKMYISHYGNSIYISSNFSFIKTWKTYNGCLNFLDKVINKSGSFYNPIFQDGTDQNIYDWSNCIYEVASIEKEWNLHIDKKISQENKRHEVTIDKLLKSKIQWDIQDTTP
jgi:hypothetical protein